jgi:hypothetical protein
VHPNDRKTPETSSELCEQVAHQAIIETLSTPFSHARSAVLGGVLTMALLVLSNQLGVWGGGVTTGKFVVIYFVCAAIAGAIVASVTRTLAKAVWR